MLLIGRHARVGLRWLLPIYLVWGLVLVGFVAALAVLADPSGSGTVGSGIAVVELLITMAMYLPAAVLVHRIVLRPEKFVSAACAPHCRR